MITTLHETRHDSIHAILAIKSVACVTELMLDSKDSGDDWKRNLSDQETCQLIGLILFLLILFCLVQFFTWNDDDHYHHFSHLMQHVIRVSHSYNMGFLFPVGSLNSMDSSCLTAGGEKKAITQKLEWKASSRIGSLENANHKPGKSTTLRFD
jgi:hypothetical protein